MLGFILTTICYTLLSFSNFALATDKVVIASFDYDSPGILEIEKKVIKMYKEANFEVEIKRFPMARALAEAIAGRVDGIIAHPMGTDELVLNLVPVGDIIKTIRFSLFSTAKEKLPIDQYKILLIRGMPYVEKVLEQKGINFITNPELNSIAELLNLGRYNATIMNENNLDWGNKKVPGLKRVSDVLAEFSMVHFVSNKRPDIIKKLTKASTQSPKIESSSTSQGHSY